MRHRDLLAALSALEPTRVTGTFERHMSLRWDDLRASAAGGRWGAPRTFEVLYLGRPPSSVIVEAYRHLVEDELDAPEELRASVLERRLVRYAVDVPNIVDLRPPATQQALALSHAELISPVGDYKTCQATGAAAHQLGLAGILAPAATGLGETLALYPTNLPVDRWPEVVSRDIWHGLPPDPRRLRAVEDETG